MGLIYEFKRNVVNISTRSTNSKQNESKNKGDFNIKKGYSSNLTQQRNSHVYVRQQNMIQIIVKYV